jgi:hypothetical protein
MTRTTRLIMADRNKLQKKKIKSMPPLSACTKGQACDGQYYSMMVMLISGE